jgi:hypothetical protein
MAKAKKITAPTEMFIYIVTRIRPSHDTCAGLARAEDILGVATDVLGADKIVQTTMEAAGLWHGTMNLTQAIEPQWRREYKHAAGPDVVYVAVRRPLAIPGVAMYAVRNKAGDYHRGGSSWTPEIQKAKIWSRSGPARSKITFFGNTQRYPGYQPPDLVQLVVGQIVVFDEQQRLDAAAKAAETREQRREKREAAKALEKATKAVETAQAQLDAANAALAAKRQAAVLASS